MVVEVTFCKMGGIMAGQYRAHQLFCGRLSIAARDGQHGYVELAAAVCGEVLQGRQHIVHFHELALWQIQVLIHNGECSAVLNGFGCELVAIEALAFERKEQAAQYHLSAVGDNVRMLEVVLVNKVNLVHGVNFRGTKVVRR